MKLQRFLTTFGLLAALGFGVMPAWGVNKEMIELQTQVQQLQQQMTLMQRSFDERMGVMRNLVEQDTDAVNKVATAITSLQGIIQKQQGDASARLDQLSGQVQALNDTLDELKARLAKEEVAALDAALQLRRLGERGGCSEQPRQHRTRLLVTAARHEIARAFRDQ